MDNLAKMGTEILEILSLTFQMVCSSEENEYNFSTSKVKKIEEDHVIK